MYTGDMSLNVDSNPYTEHLTVGRFAQATQLTRKALRLYDELGILVPDQVDPRTSYRYYHPDQMERARFIRLLRGMELPLADVRRVLEAESPEQALAIVHEHRHSFEKKVKAVHRAAQKVQAYLRKEEVPMTTKIEVQSFPARPALSIRKSITVPAFHEFIPEALGDIKAHAEQTGTELAGAPICFYYGPVNEHDDGPVEICWPIKGKAVPGGEITVREIPAHQAAVGTADQEHSRYPDILEIWDDVVTWVQKQKLPFREESVPCYEIWYEAETISVVQPFLEEGP